MGDNLVPRNEVIGSRILSPGEEGRVQGLQNATEMNGLSGTVVQYDSASGRYKILCENGQNLAVRPENFIVFSNVDPESAALMRRNSRVSETRVSMENEDSVTNSVQVPIDLDQMQGVSTGRSDRDTAFRRTKQYWESSVVYEYFPITTYVSLGGLTWIALFTIILIYGPR